MLNRRRHRTIRYISFHFLSQPQAALPLGQLQSGARRRALLETVPPSDHDDQVAGLNSWFAYCKMVKQEKENG